MPNEQDQYEKVCKVEFAEINMKLDKISRSLFIDNGGESFQSRLNRHDRLIKFTMSLLTIIMIVLMGFFAFVAQEAYRDWRTSNKSYQPEIGQPAVTERQQ